MLEQPLPMNCALWASARSLGFLILLNILVQKVFCCRYKQVLTYVGFVFDVPLSSFVFCTFLDTFLKYPPSIATMPHITSLCAYLMRSRLECDIDLFSCQVHVLNVGILTNLVQLITLLRICSLLTICVYHVLLRQEHC